MRLLEDIYHQQVEFLRKNYFAPDLLLVPYEEKHQLLGEALEKYAMSMDPRHVSLMGMRLVYVPDFPHVTAALSVHRLK